MRAYLDKTKPYTERAKNLLSLMTLTEKINQMHVYVNILPVLKDIDENVDFVPFGGMFNIDAYTPETIEKS